MTGIVTLLTPWVSLDSGKSNVGHDGAKSDTAEMSCKELDDADFLKSNDACSIQTVILLFGSLSVIVAAGLCAYMLLQEKNKASYDLSVKVGVKLGHGFIFLSSVIQFACIWAYCDLFEDTSAKQVVGAAFYICIIELVASGIVNVGISRFGFEFLKPVVENGTPEEKEKAADNL